MDTALEEHVARLSIHFKLQVDVPQGGSGLCQLGKRQGLGQITRDGQLFGHQGQHYTPRGLDGCHQGVVCGGVGDLRLGKQHIE